MEHDFSTSDHCTNCGTEQYEGKDAFGPCSNEFNTWHVAKFEPVNFPIDMRNHSERDRDAHYQAFRDGENNDCSCGDCQYWREVESEDLKKV